MLKIKNIFKKQVKLTFFKNKLLNYFWFEASKRTNDKTLANLVPTEFYNHIFKHYFVM